MQNSSVEIINETFISQLIAQGVGKRDKMLQHKINLTMTPYLARQIDMRTNSYKEQTEMISRIRRKNINEVDIPMVFNTRGTVLIDDHSSPITISEVCTGTKRLKLIPNEMLDATLTGISQHTKVSDIMGSADKGGSGRGGGAKHSGSLITTNKEQINTFITSKVNRIPLRSFTNISELVLADVSDVYLTGTMHLRDRLKSLCVDNCRLGLDQFLCSDMSYDEHESILSFGCDVEVNINCLFDIRDFSIRAEERLTAFQKQLELGETATVNKSSYRRLRKQLNETKLKMIRDLVARGSGSSGAGQGNKGDDTNNEEDNGSKSTNSGNDNKLLVSSSNTTNIYRYPSSQNIKFTIAEIQASYSWTQLKEVTFVNSNLMYIDASISLLPNLERLNLSHNKLKSVNNLFNNNKLKSLDLSFNNLTNLESLINVSSNTSLCNLNLSYNQLYSLSGIDNIINLEVLDLRHNNISNYLELVKLNSLIKLHELNIIGNPISVVDGYREVILNGYLYELLDLRALALSYSSAALARSLQWDPSIEVNDPTMASPQSGGSARGDTFVLDGKAVPPRSASGSNTYGGSGWVGSRLFGGLSKAALLSAQSVRSPGGTRNDTGMSSNASSVSNVITGNSALGSLGGASASSGNIVSFSTSSSGASGQQAGSSYGGGIIGANNMWLLPYIGPVYDFIANSKDKVFLSIPHLKNNRVHAVSRAVMINLYIEILGELVKVRDNIEKRERESRERYWNQVNRRITAEEAAVINKEREKERTREQKRIISRLESYGTPFLSQLIDNIKRNAMQFLIDSEIAVFSNYEASTRLTANYLTFPFIAKKSVMAEIGSFGAGKEGHQGDGISATSSTSLVFNRDRAGNESNDISGGLKMISSSVGLATLSEGGSLVQLTKGIERDIIALAKGLKRELKKYDDNIINQFLVAGEVDKRNMLYAQKNTANTPEEPQTIVVSLASIKEEERKQSALSGGKKGGNAKKKAAANAATSAIVKRDLASLRSLPTFTYSFVDILRLKQGDIRLSQSVLRTVSQLVISQTPQQLFFNILTTMLEAYYEAFDAEARKLLSASTSASTAAGVTGGQVGATSTLLTPSNKSAVYYESQFKTVLYSRLRQVYESIYNTKFDSSVKDFIRLALEAESSVTLKPILPYDKTAMNALRDMDQNLGEEEAHANANGSSEDSDDDRYTINRNQRGKGDGGKDVKLGGPTIIDDEDGPANADGDANDRSESTESGEDIGIDLSRFHLKQRQISGVTIGSDKDGDDGTQAEVKLTVLIATSPLVNQRFEHRVLVLNKSANTFVEAKLNGTVTFEVPLANFVTYLFPPTPIQANLYKAVVLVFHDNDINEEFEEGFDQNLRLGFTKSGADVMPIVQKENASSWTHGIAECVRKNYECRENVVNNHKARIANDDDFDENGRISSAMGKDPMVRASSRFLTTPNPGTYTFRLYFMAPERSLKESCYLDLICAVARAMALTYFRPVVPSPYWAFCLKCTKTFRWRGKAKEFCPYCAKTPTFLDIDLGLTKANSMGEFPLNASFLLENELDDAGLTDEYGDGDTFENMMGGNATNTNNQGGIGGGSIQVGGDLGAVTLVIRRPNILPLSSEESLHPLNAKAIFDLNSFTSAMTGITAVVGSANVGSGGATSGNFKTTDPTELRKLVILALQTSSVPVPVLNYFRARTSRNYMIVTRKDFLDNEGENDNDNDADDKIKEEGKTKQKGDQSALLGNGSYDIPPGVPTWLDQVLRPPGRTTKPLDTTGLENPETMLELYGIDAANTVPSYSSSSPLVLLGPYVIPLFTPMPRMVRAMSVTSVRVNTVVTRYNQGKEGAPNRITKTSMYEKVAVVLCDTCIAMISDISSDEISQIEVYRRMIKRKNRQMLRRKKEEEEMLSNNPNLNLADPTVASKVNQIAENQNREIDYTANDPKLKVVGKIMMESITTVEYGIAGQLLTVYYTDPSDVSGGVDNQNRAGGAVQSGPTDAVMGVSTQRSSWSVYFRDTDVCRDFLLRFEELIEYRRAGNVIEKKMESLGYSRDKSGEQTNKNVNVTITDATVKTARGIFDALAKSPYVDVYRFSSKKTEKIMSVQLVRVSTREDFSSFSNPMTMGVQDAQKPKAAVITGNLPPTLLVVTDRRIACIKMERTGFSLQQVGDSSWFSLESLDDIIVLNNNKKVVRLHFKYMIDEGLAGKRTMSSHWFIHCEDWRHRARVVVELYAMFPNKLPKLA